MARDPGPRATGAVSARVGSGPVLACRPPRESPALLDGAHNVTDPSHSRIILGFALAPAADNKFQLDVPP
jgi:hypothetical protein